MKNINLKNIMVIAALGLTTLITACGQQGPVDNRGPWPPVNNIPQGHMGCVPVMPNTQMGFNAQGIQANSTNLSFGQIPNSQRIGTVTMGMAAGMGGTYLTGQSNATGSRISVSLQSNNGMFPVNNTWGQPTTTQSAPTAAVGFIQLSQRELEIAGLYTTGYMSPMPTSYYPNQQYPNYNNQYPNGAPSQACVSSVGAYGTMYVGQGLYYGGDVYVYLNNGTTFIRFRI